MDDSPSVFMSDELRDRIELGDKTPGMRCLFYTREASGKWTGKPSLVADIDSIEQNIDADNKKWTTTRFGLTREEALKFLRNLPKLVKVCIGEETFMEVQVLDQLINVISDKHSRDEVDIGFSFR